MTSEPPFTRHGQDCLLRVWAKPKASRTRVVALGPQGLEVALAAPPVDGAANGELCAFLAKALRLPKGRVRLERGHSSRNKTVRLVGVGAAELAIRLREWGD